MYSSINQTLQLNTPVDGATPEYLECADVFVKMEKDMLSGKSLATLMVMPHPFDPEEERSAYRLGSTEAENVHNNEEWSDAFSDVLDKIPDVYRYWVAVDAPDEEDDCEMTLDMYDLLLAAYETATAYIATTPLPGRTGSGVHAYLEYCRAKEELEAYGR